MSEKHPIDELFHRALHDAEVTPPPAVWEGIARARRKRRAGWLRWGALALLLAGAAGLGLWRPWHQEPVAQNPGQANTTPAVPHTSIASTRPSDPAATSPEIAADQRAPGTTDIAQPASTKTVRSNDPGPNTPPPARRNSGHSPVANTGIKPEPAVPAVAASDLALETPADAPSTPRDGQEHLALLEVLGPRTTVAPAVSPLGRERSPYVLPGAEWWVALEVGRHDVDRSWSGKDEALVEALNGTEVPHPTWSAGALFGRTWRSGLGVSVGAAYEGSRYEFDHVEQQLPVDSVIEYTYLVTLDTQVFVNTPATTVVYGEPTETRVTGSNSLGILQLPVELYWHAPVKRWSFGGRIGLMTELTLVRRGYTLVNDQELGLLSAPCGEERFDSRYGPVLTGIIGADLGYTLTERWGLWLSPSYIRGLAAFGTTDQPWSMPERFSLRMRLSYSFIR